MFSNFLITGLTPLSNTNEIQDWQNRPFSAVWPKETTNEAKEAEPSRVLRRKPKRLRTAFTTEQLKTLEKTYTRFRYIDAAKRRELAATLNIGEKNIKIWFQNRRMKEKRESSESSSDSSTESRELSPSITDKDVQSICSDKSETSIEETISQYLPPTFQIQAYPLQCYDENTYVPQYGFVPSHFIPSSFSDENNVYPTQYYPTYNDYIPTFNESSYHYENASVPVGDFWYSSNFDVTSIEPNS